MFLDGGNLRELRYKFETVDPEHERVILEQLAEGFVRANEVQIEADPGKFPCCLGCGKLKYRDPAKCWVRGGVRTRSVPGCQPILGAAPLMEEGEETCYGLAILLASIKRHAGDADATVRIQPQTFVDVYENVQVKPGQWHAVVVDGEGTVHDPQVLTEAEGCGGSSCGCGGD